MSEINLTKRQKKIMINCLKYLQTNPPLSPTTGICRNVVLLMNKRRVKEENFCRTKVYITIATISKDWPLCAKHSDGTLYKNFPIHDIDRVSFSPKWKGEPLKYRQLLIQFLIDKLSE